MHQPYDIKLKHRSDFKVKYRFYNETEGGRKSLPFQGYRSDFWYFHKEQPNPNSIYMIWPEFEDSHGNVITQSDIPVPNEGIARMWIIMPPMRLFHRDKIDIGLKGFFMEGSRKVAECEVILLVDLKTNPTE
ncbi:MAG: hypothetical protein JNJ86_08135 [Chitinophagaceae bacterium]|nr:hypothetical protein [Chitinophagaceae bacterium]